MAVSRWQPAAITATTSVNLRSTLVGMPIKDGLLAEFDHEMATTRKLLDRLRDDRLSWKPHAKSASMGGLGTHLSNLPLWAANVMNAASFDLASIGTLTDFYLRHGADGFVVLGVSGEGPRLPCSRKIRHCTAA